jgi:hypothetical protein
MPLHKDSPRDTDPVVADKEVVAMAKNKAVYAHLANCLTATWDLVYVCGVTADRGVAQQVGMPSDQVHVPLLQEARPCYGNG